MKDVQGTQSGWTLGYNMGWKTMMFELRNHAEREYAEADAELTRVINEGGSASLVKDHADRLHAASMVLSFIHRHDRADTSVVSDPDNTYMGRRLIEGFPVDEYGHLIDEPTTMTFEQVNNLVAEVNNAADEDDGWRGQMEAFVRGMYACGATFDEMATRVRDHFGVDGIATMRDMQDTVLSVAISSDEEAHALFDEMEREQKGRHG